MISRNEVYVWAFYVKEEVFCMHGYTKAMANRYRIEL